MRRAMLRMWDWKKCIELVHKFPSRFSHSFNLHENRVVYIDGREN